MKKINKKDCFLYCIENLANELRGPDSYEMMYLKNWKFGYTKGESIGEKLENGYTENLLRMKTILSNYHGINIKRYSFGNIDQDINKKLQNGPIIARCDMYNCFWLPFYGIHHGMHSFIILKQSDLGYYFKDLYLESIGEVPIDFIQQYCKEVWTITICDIAIKNLEQKKEEIRKSAMLYELTGGCNMVNMFKYDLQNKFVLRNEIKKNDVVSSKLLKHLEYLSEERRSLISTFLYLYKEKPSCVEDIIFELNEVSKGYDKLRFEIIKGNYTQLDKKRLESNIKNIVRLEMNLQKKFLDFV